MPLRPYCVQRVFSILFLLALAACNSVPLGTTPDAGAPKASSKSSYPALPPAGSGRGGYYMDDGPGDDIPAGLENLPDAVPKVEPFSSRGNKPYVVFGTRYVPITDDRPYKQRGYGSWYGKKFHGQKTSSGELYDMYKMTAASPVLPIPSYARVTNLSNGKQVIVRVNDRGPFRSNRIIDLSYTAALKLGYIGHGSAQLEVERLLPADIEEILAARDKGLPATAAADNATTPAAVVVPSVDVAPLDAALIPAAATAPAAMPPASSAASALVPGFYLQFGAYSQMASAEAARARLAQDLGSALPQLRIEPSSNLYRLYSGPFASREEAAGAALQVQQAGASKPFIVQR
ncbi:MAG TPA: septal ring lytic transglycosylase RlpA family protein [Oxalicibacterium sp.]|nr:septal ring lytic transglycosylase RlpA family protein [Oxalicibacterium sp.]